MQILGRRFEGRFAVLEAKNGDAAGDFRPADNNSSFYLKPLLLVAHAGDDSDKRVIIKGTHLRLLDSTLLEGTRARVVGTVVLVFTPVTLVRTAHAGEASGWREEGREDIVGNETLNTSNGTRARRLGMSCLKSFTHTLKEPAACTSTSHRYGVI